jgi:hypothetical protein
MQTMHQWHVSHLNPVLPLLLLACLSACQVKTPGSTARDAKQLLFFDNFAKSTDIWAASVANKGQAGYTAGIYRIYVDAPNSDIWATPGLDLGDVRIETDAIMVSGDQNNRFGVLCRYTNGTKFYVFLVSSDGYFGIGKITGSTYQLLGAQSLLPSDKIPKGSQNLHIRAECIKDTLTLYVNGQLIHQVKDRELASGDIGLIAGAYDKPGTEIFFDNFSIYAP